MLNQLRQSVLIFALFLVLCGLAYPFAMTGLAGALFPTQAHGSLIRRDGKVIGSALIGQSFTRPDYFHGRPSATTDTDPNDPAKTIPAPYNAANSGASNAAPTAKSLIGDVGDRIEALKKENPGAHIPVPVDLVTTSGSGLDPHISPAAAEYQLPRVAAARGLDESAVRKLVAANTEGRTFGLLGESRVNVLALNLALDALTARK